MVVRAKVRAMSACAETLLGFITFPDLDQSQQNKKLHIRCRAGKGRDAERRKTQIYRHSTERKTQRYTHSTERKTQIYRHSTERRKTQRYTHSTERKTQRYRHSTERKT